MTTFFKARNIYKLIIIMFLIFALSKIQTQLVTLHSYNQEIAVLNEKIDKLENQANNSESSNHSKEYNEENARKNLKMYYPNETPYKGY